MECDVCRVGTLHSGTATFTSATEERTMVVLKVPGEICDTCGHSVHSDAVAARLDLYARTLAHRFGHGVFVFDYRAED